MIQIITALLLQSQTVVYDQQRFLADAYFRQVQYQKENHQLIKEQKALQEAEIRDYFFRERFNKFVIALREFAKDYQQGAVDVKKAEAVRKAWRKLEKTDGWFHEEAKKKNRKNDRQNADSEPQVASLHVSGDACQAQPQ